MPLISTTPFNPPSASISNITFANKWLPVITQDGLPHGLYLKPDGTKIFVAGSLNGYIYQYSLSTPWDVSTGSYDSKSVEVGTVAGVGGPHGVFLSPDGTKMFMVGGSSGAGGDRIHRYSLSIAWDISTATYDSMALHVFNPINNPHDVWIRNDGLKIFVGGDEGVASWTMTLAWDLTTASYDSNLQDLTTQDVGVHSIFLKPDGETLYHGGQTTDSVYEYSLSTAWDLTTLSYTGISGDASATSPGLHGISFNTDFTILYTMNQSGGSYGSAVIQYNLA